MLWWPRRRHLPLSALLPLAVQAHQLPSCAQHNSALGK